MWGKRLVSLLIALGLLSSIFASEWSIGGSLGLRYRSTSSDLISYGIYTSFDDFSFSASMIGHDVSAFQFRYDADIGKTIHNEFIFHTDIVPSEGGFSTLGYLFSQQFQWSWFFLGYGLGAQSGISYSKYSVPFYSLIPLFSLDLGVCFDQFSFIFYGTNATHDATEWKLIAALGAKAKMDINKHNSLFMDCFITLDNLMDLTDYTLSGYGVKIGYSYRGTV